MISLNHLPIGVASCKWYELKPWQANNAFFPATPTVTSAAPSPVPPPTPTSPTVVSPAHLLHPPNSSATSSSGSGSGSGSAGAAGNHYNALTIDFTSRSLPPSPNSITRSLSAGAKSDTPSSHPPKSSLTAPTQTPSPQPSPVPHPQPSPLRQPSPAVATAAKPAPSGGVIQLKVTCILEVRHDTRNRNASITTIPKKRSKYGRPSHITLCCISSSHSTPFNVVLVCVCSAAGAVSATFHRLLCGDRLQRTSSLLYPSFPLIILSVARP
jgi:hypothetical protein